MHTRPHRIVPSLRSRLLRPGFLLTALALPGGVLAGTRLTAQCGTMVVGGTVFGTWTPAGSPYCVMGNTALASLTIQAGVRVLVDPGVTLTVAGALNAAGTKEDPIVFTERAGGQGWNGIAMSGVAAAVVFDHCIIERARNSGLTIADSSPTLRHCLVRDNSTPLHGGGIYAVTNTNLVFEDCEIRDNTATRHGGGLFVELTDPAVGLALSRCRIESNTCNPTNDTNGWNFGGGLFLRGAGVLDNCWIAANLSRSHAFGCQLQSGLGGGIYADGGDLSLQNCCVMDNEAYAAAAGCCCYLGAHSHGGGIAFCAAGGNLALANTWVCGNSLTATGASSGGTLSVTGAGLFVGGNDPNAAPATPPATVAIEHCTFAFNETQAIEIASATTVTSIRNSILYFNHDLGTTPASYGPQILGTAAVTYSDVHGGATGTGNLNVNPIFVQQSSGVGGPVIHLVSPCVDAGDPAGPQDAALPPARGGPRADMGAHGGALAGSFAPPCIMVGGAQTYGLLRGGDNTMCLDWDASATPLLGAVRLQQTAPLSPAAAGYLLIGLSATETAVGNTTLLVGGSLAVFPLPPFDATGGVSVPLSLADPGLLGLTFYTQAITLGPYAASNGLTLMFY